MKVHTISRRVISCPISACYFPLPLVPSRRGRGKFTFYEFILTKRLKIHFSVILSKEFVGTALPAYRQAGVAAS